MLIGCNKATDQPASKSYYYPSNVIDYRSTHTSSADRSPLAFSDQGAWFAYGFPGELINYGGFSGPYLMTQDNGVWSSKVLSQLKLVNSSTGQLLDWSNFDITQTSFNSHLQQVYNSPELKITQVLVYASAHSVLITTRIRNLSSNVYKFKPVWSGTTMLNDLTFHQDGNAVGITFLQNLAKGGIEIIKEEVTSLDLTDSTYSITLKDFEIKPGESKQLSLVHRFIFPKDNADDKILNPLNDPEGILQSRVDEKKNQLALLYTKLDTLWQDSVYKSLMAKTVLTLQNNWRIPAGELKHSGLFPSYHYKWFHGFWAWDSWKHAVALAQYDTQLAKEQVRAMYDFQTLDGFIPDCIYRDTTIEKHNYRNTKPPLSAWAVWEIFRQIGDSNFVKELYPKIALQHKWWYVNRDHDQDGLCEYGSTDGSLIAAKWESGMDNAVRFDDSKILKNSFSAYSLNQESVDLNAYLFAEKHYLTEMAKVLKKNNEADEFNRQAALLKDKIQNQFYDTETGWFYDTSIDGKQFIKAMGCEGWIPMWANAVTQDQAEAVKNNMMNPTYFNTKVPLQTLSASHPKFQPNGGYWRGPTWLDQAYFGVRGLHQYGYHDEAYAATYKLMHNAAGVLSKGQSIRENYQPITGEGLESENFSWSAAHYLLLLINEGSRLPLDVSSNNP